MDLRFDGRFRLGDVLGSGSYAVMYQARNIIKDDVVTVKLEPIIDGSSSVQCEYYILKQLEGGVGIPCALWFGRESTYHALLLSRLKYIHSHNYVHGDIKPQNVAVGLHDLRHTIFIIDFSIAKKYCDISTRQHVPFHHNRRLTSTPAFTSINNHLGVEPGRHDDLESLTYMLIYFLHSSLPWLNGDHKKLSTSSMLEHKANTTIKVLCHGIPVEFATMLIYACSLAFSEDLDYDHLHSLLHVQRFIHVSPFVI
ncbi:kinase-like protein [Suillus decipiens]|nr:kinase-like protein [Suillus decipiens]